MKVRIMHVSVCVTIGLSTLITVRSAMSFLEYT